MRLTKIVLICSLFIQPAFANEESATYLYDRAFPHFDGINTGLSKTEQTILLIEILLTLGAGALEGSTQTQFNSFVDTVGHALALEDLKENHPHFYQLRQAHLDIAQQIALQETEILRLDDKIKQAQMVIQSRSEDLSVLLGSFEESTLKRTELQNEISTLRESLEEAKIAAAPAEEAITKFKITFAKDVLHENSAQYRGLFRRVRWSNVFKITATIGTIELYWKMINASYDRDSGISPILTFTSEVFRPLWESIKTETPDHP